MSFKAKTDYYGVADGTSIVCVSSDDATSNSVTEAKAADGSIIEAEVFGETMSPSCEYAIKAKWSVTEGHEKKLGGVNEVGEKSFALLELSIDTQAGSIPKVSAGGEQVEDDATEGCVYKVPTFELEKKAHAQVLFGAFQLSGNGCHLQAAKYAISASIQKAMKDGVCLAFDVVEGKIEVDITVLQVGDVEPTITAGDGFKVTAVPTRSNPDSDNPTWTAKLTCYLEKED